MARVLIIGSLEAELGAAARIAAARGARLAVAEGAAAGLARLRSEGADLVLCDVLHDVGWLIGQLANERIACPVVACGRPDDAEGAVRAIRAGAKEFLPLPPDADLIAAMLQAVAGEPDRPVVRDAAMTALLARAEQVARAEASVLITGESGTGKSLIARAIHDFSDRRTLPFVVAQAADLAGVDGPATLLSKARGGSIVFDEVADYDADTQARVVRMLDMLGDKAPRVMATSQSDLTSRMDAGQFRQDLYYRLGGVTLHVPSLRERVEDIPLLAEHFLTRGERDLGTVRRLSQGASDLVRAYSWPGNVRQLENTIRRLLVTASETEIARAEVEQVLGQQPSPEPLAGAGAGDKLSASVARHLKRYFDLHGGQLPPAGVYQRILREVELPLIEIALDATAGNQAKCADLLGINRNTLRKKITDLDIRVTRRRKLM